MNRKNIIIIIIVVISMLGGIIVLKGNSTIMESRNTGAFTEMKYYGTDYIIEINSSEVGHPSGDSIFSTFYNYEYDISYYLIEENINLDYPQINEYEKIRINNKEFYYSNNKEQYLDLLYKIDQSNYLKVAITSLNNREVFEGILDNKDLQAIINFNVRKNK